MASLNFKTKLNSHPQGKPKVYFSCHEDDFIYFDDICKDIFEYSDCAIWYFNNELKFTDSEFNEEEYFDSLKKMQLFVMPITTKLLTTKNRAIDIEFKFALDNHIPVLPLMKETGLEELFNKVCGDLQFLDKRKKDNTGIKYQDKLKNHLSSVLVGDELASKIRAAFDAYVFLSYRKKDRKHAEELMKLIHKDPLCRDIAIWYDEFLVPGENFNDSIKYALQKSDLFVMAVTPNLINENNYIINIEYPMAKKENKPIVPVEVVETDKDKAKSVFSELPIIINASDEDLTNRMMKDIKRVAIEANNTPEHNYFIGLAYLNGIDVEVDYQKGFELIESSANQNLLEAINKLIDIFKHGIGVKINYSIALKWLNKKIEVLENENKDKAQLFDTYLEISELLIDLLDYKTAISILRKAENIDTKDNDKKSKLFMVLGSIYENEYQLDTALDYYNKALEHSIKLDKTIENNILIANCYLKIGKIKYKNYKYKDALDIYNKAYNIFINIDEEYLTEDIKLDFTTLLKAIGTTYTAINDSVKALEYLEKAYEIGYKLLFSLNGIEYADEFIETEMTLGNVYFKDRIYNEASVYYTNVEMMSAGLTENKGTLNFIISHIKAKNKLGNTYIELKEFDSAKARFEEALELSLKLIENCDVVSSKRELSICYTNLGYIYILKGDYNKAIECYKKSYDILQKLDNNNLNLRHDLYIYYSNMVLIHQKLGEYDKAIECYEKQSTIYDNYLKDSLESINIKRNVSISYFNLGMIYHKLGNKEKALENMYKQLQLREELYNLTKANEQVFDYASGLFSVGLLHKIYNMTDNVIEYYNKAVSLTEELVKNHEIMAARKNLVKYYEKIYKFYGEKKNLLLAEEALDKCLYNKRIINQREKAEEKLNLVYAESRLGNMKYILGEYSVAKELYEGAIYYLLDIEEFEKIGLVDDLIKILNKISDIYLKLGFNEVSNRYKKYAEMCSVDIYNTELQKELNEIYLDSADKLIESFKSKMLSKEAIKILDRAISKRLSLGLNVEGKLKLANNYYLMADIYFSHLRDFRKALEYNFKEFKLREELILGNENVETLSKLSVPCIYISRCYRLLGELDNCEEYLFKYLKIKKGIYSLNKDESTVSGLAYAYNCLSEFYEESLLDYKKAIKFKKEEVKYLEEVVNYDDCKYNQEDLDVARKKLLELNDYIKK